MRNVHVTRLKGRSLSDEGTQEGEDSEEEGKEVHSRIGDREFHDERGAVVLSL
jgi:hypothetical protein